MINHTTLNDSKNNSISEELSSTDIYFKEKVLIKMEKEYEEKELLKILNNQNETKKRGFNKR